MNDSVKSVSRQQPQPIVIDFGKIWNLVVLNWYWFVVSVIACAILAGVYLWFTSPTVSVTGKMQIVEKSKQNSGISAGLAMLNNLPMGLGNAIGGSLGGNSSADAEIEILKSTRLVREVVNDLGLHTEYKLCRWGRKTTLYKDRPVNVVLDPAHLLWLDDELPLSYHEIKLTLVKDADGFRVETTLKENKDETDLPDQTFSSLPAVVKTEFGTLTISPNDSLAEKELKRFENGYKLKVKIVPPMMAANEFISRLSAETPSKKVSNMLNIALRDENAIRGIDFIDHLIKEYNQRANDDKNEEARKTDEFVNARIAKIDAELGSSDAAWENSKKNFQITDPEVDATEVVEKKSKYEAQLVEIGTQLQLHDYLSEYINNADNLYEIIPVGLGIAVSADNDATEPSSNSSIIARHNSLVNQRKDLLKSMSDKAPQILRLSESIRELHPTLVMAMKRDRQNLILKRNSVEREYSKYMGKVSAAPKMERVLTEIGRQREIKQGVYLLMLEKREETAMDLANVADKGKLIDVIQMVPRSNTPKKSVVLAVSVFLGLLIAFGVLLFLQMIYSRIDTNKDLKPVTKRPILGDVPLSNSDESIRNVRTNLLQNLKPEQKVILVTSDSNGDGKSFIANQLADSLSSIGKKALYFNADLRSIGSSSVKHPADTLASVDFANQIANAKIDNDYVIIDTPSLSNYADAYQVAQYADVTIFVVKSEKTDKSVIKGHNSETRLPNLMYVLNALDMTKKKIKKCYKNTVFVLMSLVLFSSCMSTKNITYFQNKDQIDLTASKFLYDAKIMPKDILQIQVFTMTPEASEPFNLLKPSVSSMTTTSTTGQGTVYDYLVDNDGNIDYPVLGKLHLGGLGKTEAEQLIKEKIKPYMSESENVVVHVRMMNYKYAVMGGVKNPGVFTTQNEKVNILEAIAQAGDLTTFAYRDRIFLIRENSEGQKEYHQLNINDANIVSSPYYYLQQNDVIYVEPRKMEARNAFISSNTSVWFSLVSSLMSITTFIIALSK